MLTLQLEQSRQVANRRLLGPIGGLRLQGRSARILSTIREVLRLVGNQWCDQGFVFDALLIEEPTLLYAEENHTGKSYGPFEFLRIECGTIYISKDLRRTIGRFDAI